MASDNRFTVTRHVLLLVFCCSLWPSAIRATRIAVFVDSNSSECTETVTNILQRFPGAQVTLTVPEKREDCSVCHSLMSVHLTPACLQYLDHDVFVPAVSIPAYGVGSVWTFSLANDHISHVDVLSAITKRSRWKSMAFLTDDAGDVQFVSALLMAGREVGCPVSPIFKLVDNLSAEVVVQRLVSSSADVVLVHCKSMGCLRLLHQVADRWMKLEHRKNVPWILTEQSIMQFQGNRHWWSALSLLQDVPLMGIRRHLKGSHASLQLLQYMESPNACACSQHDLDVLCLHDAIMLLQNIKQHVNSSEMTIGEMISEINLLKLEGLMGHILFEMSSGARVAGQYEVLNIGLSAMKMIGLFDVRQSRWIQDLSLPETVHERTVRGVSKCDQADGSEMNLIVTSVLEEPWMMRSGNDPLTSVYIGLNVDIVQALSSRIGFNYTIRPPPDGKYGAVNETTGEATGMIAELINCSADMAIALGINAKRSRVIDFSEPFLSSGFAVLTLKPAGDDSNFFDFLNPFSFDTWITILGTAIAVSLVMPLVHRLSPYGRTTEEEALDKPFTFKVHRSVWYFCTSFLQVGPEGASFISGKIVLCAWFLFCMIIVATYTANLAAFVTTKGLQQSVKSVDQLSRQTQIVYGTVTDSNVYDFFQESLVTTYRRMGAFIDNTPEALLSSAEEGVQRVRDWDERHFAFIWDVLSLEYAASQKPCTTHIIGRTFGQFGVAFGFPVGSTLVDHVSEEVVKMREDGVLDELKIKWGFGGGECGNIRASLTMDSTSEEKINLEGVRGVFIVMAVVVGVACGAIVVEWVVWKVRSRKAH